MREDTVSRSIHLHAIIENQVAIIVSIDTTMEMHQLMLTVNSTAVIH